eukprot:TRINITY_DN45304_c0_g1_i1.p1 TRINITY_DN45304_c0_g1~~TRINITY_DN45304_c0_g1_i1.p1  ORF type:complete len:349 (-),score=42.90 TRINITY_DN45304_c0_g1_i1:99-1145(-)
MADIAIDPGRTICPECKSRRGPPVMDCTTGDLVCTGCGLVLQGQCIDEGQEWRSFKQEGVESGMKVNSRERAEMQPGGGDELCFDVFGTSSTAIAGTSLAALGLQKAQSWQDREGRGAVATKSDRATKHCQSKIYEYAKKLTLDESITRRALELIDALSKMDALPSRAPPHYFLGLLYLACKDESAGRTHRELAVTQLELDPNKETRVEKAIKKVVDELTAKLGDELREPRRTIEADEFMGRWVSRLQLSREICQPAAHICKQVSKLNIATKGPIDELAVAAAAIFMVAWLLDVERKPSFADVAAVAKVGEPKVRALYAKIRAQIRALLAELPGFQCKLVGGPNRLPL